LSKLLLLSWREVVRAFGKVGFKIGRQNFSAGLGSLTL
jgi:predicted RNA binding protein YcfA (HicA-like mRNA interferase family)